jgi:hypothetical protein
VNTDRSAKSEEFEITPLGMENQRLLTIKYIIASENSRLQFIRDLRLSETVWVFATS